MRHSEDRKNNLMPNGIPKWIRCFDNGGKTFDRYTVIFTHAHSFGLKGYTVGIGMSESPFSPQGFGLNFEYRNSVYDGRTGGKKISFTDLPIDCQRAVIDDYKEYWNLQT